MLEKDRIIPSNARTDHERNLMKIATRGGEWNFLVNIFMMNAALPVE